MIAVASPTHFDVIPLAELRAQFGLAGARAVLLVGSRTEDDYPGSDTDFLGLFDRDADVPRAIGHAGAVSMTNTFGESWIGWAGEEEVNVVTVSAEAVRRTAAPLAAPLSATRAPALQPLEVVLLHRIHTGTPVDGHDYVAELRAGLRLDRLPTAVFALYHISAAGHLKRARMLAGAGDRLGFLSLMNAVTSGVGIATLSMYGRVAGSVKKIAPGLAVLERAHLDIPVRSSDLALMMSSADDVLRLEIAGAALDRLAAAARLRAEHGDPLWDEAWRSLAALG
ncbi:hypothetical protein [Sphaerisporangium aureirubrum]|uniref:Nucleotidyltransferase domain-containing protein n=1 Tax=Sphaerisporangium aureirubrum TaxID=1544736 RepID=A0ABW1NLJ1_9ACTN